ncbi:response regulator [Sphingomonas profundi]|uniref:response regulator n=1 Tax=Alterirhizorhabdus profundi TaxID=2681549 RepID=UPI0012E7DEB0|nr:response regulator [Sphingomonas profundi]
MTGPRAGTRVLIVEDEPIIAMTAEDIIEEMGCIVAGSAATLEQATALAAAGGFDVAMLDINLNGETSLPVAAALHAAGTPFVFTTGYGSAGPGSDFSGVEVVKKPYRAIDLACALGRLAR